MKENEIWIDVKGFEGIYQVSSYGRVKALSMRKLRGRFYHNCREKIMKQNKKRNGYLTIELQNNSIEKTIGVHRLVAINFIPNPENKDTVNHKNGIKTDNRVENLEWATIYENVSHALKTGLKKKQRGEQIPISKLKESEVKFIRLSNMSKIDLANKFNVYKSTIYKIKSRQTWRHI